MEVRIESNPFPFTEQGGIKREHFTPPWTELLNK